MPCQLDYLCSLPNDAEKRKALSSLPLGLNAIYERILERVNHSGESIQRMVQNTLQWIVSPIDAISATALCHAISIQDGDRIMDQEAFYDEEDILMHCSSLIHRSANGETLEMAHFTVKEFLAALDPDINSPYSRYSQVEKFVYPQLSITCLTYVTMDCFYGSVVEDLDVWNEQHRTEYPFRQHAVEHWVDYAQNSWENARILELSRKLFDPSATACFLSWARDLVYLDAGDERSHSRDHDDHFDTFTRYFCAGGLKPLHMAAALGLPEICRWLIASGCGIDDRSNAGTPLHCALLGTYWLSKTLLVSTWSSELDPFEYYPDVEIADRMQVLEILIANNADCNTSYRDRFGKAFSCNHLAFYSDIGQGAEHPLVKLVAAGARLDDQLLKQMDDALDRVLGQEEFIEALVSQLKETNQDHSIRLQAALKLNSSSGFDMVKSHSTGLIHTSIEDLVDLFRSAVRFDQIQVMEELIRDRRLDVSSKNGDSDTTFLHDASEWKSIGAVRLLLSLGVDVNPINENGWTPLHFAVDGEHGNERY